MQEKLTYTKTDKKNPLAIKLAKTLKLFAQLVLALHIV